MHITASLLYRFQTRFEFSTLTLCTPATLKAKPPHGRSSVLRSTSCSNWPAVEHTLSASQVRDVPPASLPLCAGNPCPRRQRILTPLIAGLVTAQFAGAPLAPLLCHRGQVPKVGLAVLRGGRPVTGLVLVHVAPLAVPVIMPPPHSATVDRSPKWDPPCWLADDWWRDSYWSRWSTLPTFSMRRKPSKSISSASARGTAIKTSDTHQ
jgi:hypothetical protein